MKLTRFNTPGTREPLCELAASELTAIQGGAVDDFPWDKLKELVAAIAGGGGTSNPMPSPRTVCFPK